jgi:hypothetical protein
MIFGYFTLFVALIISAVAAYYSIVGLTAIFSAAVIPIIIMGASLEVGKVTAAVWLKLNWHRANFTYKLYLVPAVAFLMLLTSMGIFGFLSKAHSDQSLVSGDVQSKIAVYDEKIKTAKDNIDANRKALKQMDEAVDQVMGRSADEKGADKAVSIRRSQAKERARLLSEISAEQKTIATVNEARAPIAAEVRKVEAEVGPIKYIAAVVYGDNPDTNLLEKAVRWVIILIVAVFDPLALVLILAAQQSIRWAREEQEQKEYPTIADLDRDVGVPPTAEELQLQEEHIPDEIDKDTSDTESKVEPAASKDPHFPGWMFTDPGEHPKDTLHYEQELIEAEVETEAKDRPIADSHPYLNQPFVHFKDLTPMVYKPIVEQPTIVTTPEESTQLETVEQPQEQIPEVVPETAKRYKAPIVPVPETRNIRKEIALVADNVESSPARSDFGTKFPDSAAKGDMFLRVDYLPNKLFKFNGSKWIEVDKSKTDSYTYNEQYILFLIEKLKTGEYDIDQLSASEQELVAEKLNQLDNDQT